MTTEPRYQKWQRTYFHPHEKTKPCAGKLTIIEVKCGGLWHPMASLNVSSAGLKSDTPVFDGRLFVYLPRTVGPDWVYDFKAESISDIEAFVRWLVPKWVEARRPDEEAKRIAIETGVTTCEACGKPANVFIGICGECARQAAIAEWESLAKGRLV